MDLQQLREYLELAKEIDTLADADLRQLFVTQLKSALAGHPITDAALSPDGRIVPTLTIDPRTIPALPVNMVPTKAAPARRSKSKPIKYTPGDNRQRRIYDLVWKYGSEAAPVSATDLIEVALPEDRYAISNTLSRLYSAKLLKRVKAADKDAGGASVDIWKYWADESLPSMK